MFLINERMPGTVCVTGAAGFVGSWIVKALLEKGYTVRGTVRDKTRAKHLKALPFAEERLSLHEADLLQENSFDEIINGCEGVFHTASPFFFKVSNPETQLIKPAVEGTHNVLRAVCKSESVKRVIVTSSTAAVMVRNVPEDYEFTEEDWSDVELQNAMNMWYLLSKTLAEKAVWDFYDKLPSRFVIISVCRLLFKI
jgi:nucleoside-diphosphate-sugar epimerase